MESYESRCHHEHQYCFLVLWGSLNIVTSTKIPFSEPDPVFQLVWVPLNIDMGYYTVTPVLVTRAPITQSPQY